MDREKMDRWCERGILGLVLAILIFGPLATGAVRTLELLVIQGLTLGVIVLWGARLWLSQRMKLLWPPICWAVLVFVGYAIVRYQLADIEYVARQELIKILIYAFLFFAILNNLHGREPAQIISVTLIFLGMGISFYALYQFLTGSTRVWHFISPYAGRGMGTFISPNNLAGFLEMLLPLGLAYTLTGRLNHLTKVFVGYATLALAAGIGVSISRGSWVATALVLMIFCCVLLLRRSHRIQAAVVLTVLVVGTAVFLTKGERGQERLKRTFSQGKVSDTRFELWAPTVQMWQDNFWWGVGPGHFDYRFRAYRPQSIQLRPDHSHNDYLNTLADWGVVGTVIVSAAWLLLYWGVFKTWRYVGGAVNDFGARQSSRFAFVLGASLGLLAMLLHSVVDFNIHIPANAILAIALMALLTGHLRFTTERYWVTSGWPGKLLATMVLLGGILYLGQQGWRRANEYVWLNRGEVAPSDSTAQIAAMEKAFAIEPMNFETAFVIGKALREQSFLANSNFRELAQKAMDWYERAQNLNPYDGYNYLGYGMCLDWLERHSESKPYFERAYQLDPNGYFTLAYIGRHYVEMGQYAAAKPWFERSLRLQWKDNPIAENYLAIANERLAEAASRQDGVLLPGLRPAVQPP
ncbi:MAG: O-antigen ligase family protein [Verrucomicrobia bacterium]|nr:O-antigen ligase family protein [Verrucomicrobiota bacterium]